MTEIRTFVFFDIEATGLPGVDPPKITEIAFLGCLREHLLQATENEIPRVMYKLLLPLSPQKVIHPEATRITGLDNFMLEHIKKMDTNTVDLFNCFFKQLIQPVCLVAHYGKNFDYPVLKAHIEKLNCSIFDELLCVDSWEMFKSFVPGISYKQTEIYERLYGCEPIAAHNAEADTINLMMCAIATRHEFVRRADSMATKFITS